MKISVVSMTYNDGYKLNAWREHYETYKEQIENFVIVDNASTKEYVQELKTTFPEAIIIERESNGGCTAAYNDGIRYVLENTDSNAIAIIANDIKITQNCLPAMYEFLYSDEKLGMVSSAILNINSDIIDNYGHKVKGFFVECENTGDKIGDIAQKRKYTELVSGGFTMAKREFYQNAGLQDEALFMYCDELDTYFKAKKNNFKLGVIADEYAWHWHIEKPGEKKRSSASRYLISRNRVYLAKKHGSKWALFKQVVRGTIYIPLIFMFNAIRRLDKGYFRDAKYSFVGVIHGLKGRMYTNKYTKF
ncbi:MAG: glycosyltransferase family 2 protein [Clostridia bacterium]|nr:glycosyltransferase family 2 protein [Clostridia bacterium]